MAQKVKQFGNEEQKKQIDNHREAKKPKKEPKKEPDAFDYQTGFDHGFSKYDTNYQQQEQQQQKPAKSSKPKQAAATAAGGEDDFWNNPAPASKPVETNHDDFAFKFESEAAPTKKMQA